MPDTAYCTATAAAAPKQLYTVLEQQKAAVGAGTLMGSEHTYVIPGKVRAPPACPCSNRRGPHCSSRTFAFTPPGAPCSTSLHLSFPLRPLTAASCPPLRPCPPQQEGAAGKDKVPLGAARRLEALRREMPDVDVALDPAVSERGGGALSWGLTVATPCPPAAPL